MKLLHQVAIILCAATMLTMAGCSNSNASLKSPAPSAVTAKLQSEMKFPEMIEVKSERLSKYYTIPSGTVKQSSVYICSSSASADEIAVFEADSTADADKVKAAVQKRIDSKTAIFADYGEPQEASDIKDCVLETKGSYVLFAITSDSSKARKIMENCF